MDHPWDELYNAQNPEATPCRWLVNVWGCRHSAVFVVGYAITAACAGLTILLSILVFVRQGCYRHLWAHPFKWPPLVQFLLVFGVGNILFFIHSALVLANVPSSYTVREFFRIFSFPFIFYGFRIHLSSFVTMAASIDFDTLHYGLRKRTVQMILHTITPLAVLGSILSVLDAWAVDSSMPMVNRWLLTSACIIYVFPCAVASWCSFEYGMRFSYIVDVQIKEAQAISSHFWNSTHIKPHDPSSPLFIQAATTLSNMKSVHLAALVGTSATLVHMIIIAGAQMNIFRVPIFSEILFFTFHVCIGFYLLAIVAYMAYHDVLTCTGRRKGDGIGTMYTCGYGPMDELEIMEPPATSVTYTGGHGMELTESGKYSGGLGHPEFPHSSYKM
ncbi:MAG: hypothetical protein DHS80DRAFT_28674 [Piptocephalis tieghemiana]|nr:MAG: hypothetical protein DHS80DRAFT_28674 [Piptocephalis tieghemiana]